MREFRLSAVVLGLIVDLASTFAGGVALGLAFAVSAVSPDRLATTMQSTGALAAAFAVGACGTLLGGYVAARCARHAPLLHGATFGVAALGLGLLWGDAFTASLPAWYQFAGWVSVVPLGLLGSSMVRRDAPVSAVAAALAR